MKTLSEALATVIHYDRHSWAYELGEDDQKRIVLVIGGCDPQTARMKADNHSIPYDRVIKI